MSGGSLNYGQDKLEEIAYNIQHCSKDPVHLAFAKHLRKCGEAVHALEWMLSGDTSAGDEIEAIRKVITRRDLLKSITEDAQIVLKDLHMAIKEAEK
jgi:hypothetical protein